MAADMTTKELLTAVHTDEYRFVELSTREARELETDHAELAEVIDSAQGDVFSGDKTASYVVIRIVPDRS